MFSLLNILPLIAKGTGDPINITDSVIQFSEHIAEGFAEIGIGIGAIMLLVVVFYYASSILNGGQFQLKMLIPLLIFFFVCHFSWISKPVTYFTKTLSESLVSACAVSQEGIKEKIGCDGSASLNDMYNTKHQDEATQEAQDVIDKATDKETSDQSLESPRGIIARGVKRGMGYSVKKGMLETQAEVSTYGLKMDEDSTKGNKPTTRNLGILSLFSGLISLICQLMSFVMRAFGAIMTSLIVAFGPITFAFAIFPGQGGTIKSWFIRLCQFALWVPICALVDCFSVHIFDVMAESTGASILMTIAVAICNLVCLTSVPSIASMIIEGAQGAVSLSQGLQMMGSSLTAAAGVGAAAFKGAGKAYTAYAGRDNPLSRLGAGLSEGGVKGFMNAYNQHKQSGSSNPFKGAMTNTQILGRKAMNNQLGRRSK